MTRWSTFGILVSFIILFILILVLIFSKQHEEGLALTMLAEQKEDGGLEGAFQPRKRPTDALVYEGIGCNKEGT